MLGGNAATAAAPHQWRQYTAADGRVYLHDTLQNQTRWLWEKYTDASSRRVYYHNILTSETRWAEELNRPQNADAPDRFVPARSVQAALASPAAGAATRRSRNWYLPLPDEAEEHDPDGRRYFFNRRTKTSRYPGDAATALPAPAPTNNAADHALQASAAAARPGQSNQSRTSAAVGAVGPALAPTTTAVHPLQSNEPHTHMTPGTELPGRAPLTFTLPKRERAPAQESALPAFAADETAQPLHTSKKRSRFSDALATADSFVVDRKGATADVRNQIGLERSSSALSAQHNGLEAGRGDFRCQLCSRNFKDVQALKAHTSSKKHRSMAAHMQNSDALLSDGDNHGANGALHTATRAQKGGASVWSRNGDASGALDSELPRRKKGTRTREELAPEVLAAVAASKASITAPQPKAVSSLRITYHDDSLDELPARADVSSDDVDGELALLYRHCRWAWGSVTYEPQGGRERIIGRCQNLEKDFLRMNNYEADPEDVRPPDVLEKALDFLLNKYRLGEYTYSYMVKQFKSLRQDLMVQSIRSTFTVRLYEEHARIAVEHCDVGELNQCLTQLRELYPTVPSTDKFEFYAYGVLYEVYSSLVKSGSQRGIIKILSEIELKDHKQPLVAYALSCYRAIALRRYWRLSGLMQDAPKQIVRMLDLVYSVVASTGVLAMAKAYRPSLPVSVIARRIGRRDGEDVLDFLRQVGAVVRTADDGEDADYRGALVMQGKESAQSVQVLRPERITNMGGS